MPPHRNHVEERSSRKPARQYVSETHDHKPNAPSYQRELDAVAEAIKEDQP